ncbi:ABC transporter ATP-binding protein [Gorillibacterium massiliense]|uniref:ABC transporter ATP-binding protein n=1 Tax=Gorillibacterium massiliense TaxID=1280390 RepID=UPI0004B91829|nr:ABC transporter ATP-binding protein [Gorillibacterium massiliense]
MEPIIRVDNLGKHFGNTVAVDRISFSLAPGKCTALLGPNGAGKTTTLNMLTGLLTPTKGDIVFAGLEGKDRREQIGYLPQTPVFFNWMTGKEYLHFTAKLYGMKPASFRKRTDELLELMGLKDARNRRIGGYSGGMKQRLGFAQALIHSPKLLILDEPVSALDPVGRREVLELMNRIKGETTLLFSTHVLHDAEQLSDDILIMKNGSLVLAGSLDEIRREHRSPILIVDADDATSNWVESIRQLPFIKHVEYSGSAAVISVTDPVEARRVLLADLTAKDVPVIRFEAAYTTLEDVFLKAVTQ